MCCINSVISHRSTPCNRHGRDVSDLWLCFRLPRSLPACFCVDDPCYTSSTVLQLVLRLWFLCINAGVSHNVSPPNSLKTSPSWQEKQFSYLNKMILILVFVQHSCSHLIFTRTPPLSVGARGTKKGVSHNGLGLAGNSCGWIKMQHYMAWPRLVRVRRDAVTGTFRASQLR